MKDEGEQESLLKKSEGDPEAYRRKQVASIILALSVVIAITIAIFVAKAYYSKTEKQPPKIVATAIEPKSEVELAREQAEAEVRKKEEERIEAEKIRRIYAGLLEIRSLRIKKKKGMIDVSGTILNKGNRQVGSVILALYCLDTRDRPILEKQFEVKLPGDETLGKHRRVRFKADIENAPEETADVEVIVKDITFAD